MGTLSWFRQRTSGTAAAAPFQTNVDALGLAPGDTVRRVVVTFDWWVDSNTTEFIDVGRTVNYGVSVGNSVLAPTYTPWTDFNTAGARWLWWDQLELRPIEIFDVAGTVYYLSKNGNGSRYIDTRVQHKNTSGAAEDIWFSVEPDPGNLANWSDTYWTVSTAVLYETP